jgi:arylsulfatase
MRNLLFGISAAWLIAHGALAQESLPKPLSPFQGRVDVSRDNSVPDWPSGVTPPAGAPNVLLILLDDVGFGATSTFGGPVVTPELDRLASAGLRYNRFHVNSLCSPTRAALLSGRNDHQIGFGTITELAAGYPGYNSYWGPQYASVAKVLQQNGYSTAAFGKWHNTPLGEVSPVGPFDRWPTGLGFDYFYGFMAAQDNQWHPRLYRNTTPVEPPFDVKDGYHLSADLADDAIRWLHQHDAVAPSRPFFLYFATGATHTPHHVPAEWIAKYKGKFDQGWDKLREETFARQKRLGVIPANAELTPRPKELPAWDSIPVEERRLLARQMEVYAAFLAHTDYEVGRVIQAVHEEGLTDSTLVLYIVGDNGASGEGGLDGVDAVQASGKPETIAARLTHVDDLGGELFTNHYAAAWAWATNTPFQWTKQVASHLGGTRDPLIVSWPARIKDRGGLRTQFHHVIDVAPTIYEAAGIKFPDSVDGVKQEPLAGTSLVYTFDRPDAPSTHHVQYFEMVGNRGIYRDGWWAGARHLLPWELANTIGGSAQIGQHPWELYNLNEDYSQAHDLAAKYPEKLQELEKLFDSEARRNNVYPLLPFRDFAPSPADGRTSFTYRAGVNRIPLFAAPRLAGISHAITAELNIPPGGASGVIIAEGGRFGGFSLFVKDGHVVYVRNANGAAHDKIVVADPLPTGRVEIAFEFTADSSPNQAPLFRRFVGSSGTGKILINGKVAAEGKLTHSGGSLFGETLDVGSDLGTAVSEDYASPFAFTGSIETVKIDLKNKSTESLSQ